MLNGESDLLLLFPLLMRPSRTALPAFSFLLKHMRGRMHLLPAEGARHRREMGEGSSTFSPDICTCVTKASLEPERDPSKRTIRTGKLGRWLSHQVFVCKHEGLNSVPRTHVKSLVILVLRRQRQEDPPGLLVNTSSI